MVHLKRFGLLTAALAMCLLAGSLPGDEPKAKGKDKDKDDIEVASHRMMAVAVNDKPGWKIKVSVDKADQDYKVGDEVVVTVKSAKDGYLYLINTDPKGKITVVYPNPYQKDNKISADDEITIPDPKDKTFRFRVLDPGKEMLVAIVRKSQVTAVSADDLTRGKGPKQITAKQFARMAVESMTGTSTGDDDVEGTAVSIVKKKKKFQQDDPVQYEQKCKQWASAKVEFIVTSKGKKTQQDDASTQDDKKKKQDD